MKNLSFDCIPYFGKTIVPVRKKTILLEKAILPFPGDKKDNKGGRRGSKIANFETIEFMEGFIEGI